MATALALCSTQEINMVLLTFALVGAVIKVDLRTNMVDCSSGVASSVASGVACPPHWLPAVLGAGILPQSPAAGEAEEPNRGRLLPQGDACPNDPTLGCKGKEGSWFTKETCCTECAKDGGGSIGSGPCTSEWDACRCAAIFAASSTVDAPTPPPPSSPPQSPPPPMLPAAAIAATAKPAAIAATSAEPAAAHAAAAHAAASLATVLSG